MWINFIGKIWAYVAVLGLLVQVMTPITMAEIARANGSVFCVRLDPARYGEGQTVPNGDGSGKTCPVCQTLGVGQGGLPAVAITLPELGPVILPRDVVVAAQVQGAPRRLILPRGPPA